MNARRDIARKSVMITAIGQVSSYILSFFSRKMVLMTLGVDYLGLNSTITQMLGTLSVSELGIQTVIIYKLYKPVVEGDRRGICEIMGVIRFLYRVVAAFILAASLVMIPFLQWMITDVSIPWSRIYLAWIMMACTTALSYTMNYNSTILFADQKQYLYQGIHLVLNITLVAVNCVLLYVVRSYFLFLAIGMVNTIAGNGVLLLLRRKLYPWVRYVKASKELVKDITRSALDVFAGKVSAYVFNSTDHIVISALISTALVGYAGNYTTIFLAGTYLISSLCGPIQAMVGNMLAAGGDLDIAGFMKRFSYAIYFIGVTLIIPTALLVDDFITLFYGLAYRMDKTVVYLLVADMYISQAQSSTGVMLDAGGQFSVERRFYIVSSVINIFCSVVGALSIGLAGVFLGTVIGRSYLWVSRAYNCHKYIVKNTGRRFCAYIFYNAIWLSVFLATFVLLRIGFDQFLSEVSILMFIVKGAIAVAATIGVQFLLFGRTQEFQYLYRLVGLKHA